MVAIYKDIFTSKFWISIIRYADRSCWFALCNVTPNGYNASCPLYHWEENDFDRTILSLCQIILSFENCWKLLRISRDYRETEHATSQRKSIWRIWFQPFTPPSLLPYCKKSQGAPKNNYRKLLQARVRARSSSRSALTENHISISYVVSYCLQNTTLWILGNVKRKREILGSW